MDQDRKLYMYVYRSILVDIFNNIYIYNDKLPTLPKLCDTYGVGRNTVRNALLRLQKDGYISMQRGARATVVFNHDVETLHQQYVQSLAEIKDIIKDSFETMEYIFPYIGTLALKNASKEQMDMILDKVDNFDIDNIHNEAQLIKELFEIYEVGFSFMNNPILDDLVTTILYSMYLLSYNEKNKLGGKISAKNIQTTLKMILKTKSSFIIKNSIAGLCHTYGKMVNDYVAEICQDMPPVKSKEFIWAVHREEDYLYMKVVAGIVADINNHLYKKGDLLPSISQIAQQYNVSERTSRRALEALRDYRIIQTFNGIGSKITINVLKNNKRLLNNAKIKNHIQAYCNASQLLSMLNEVMIPKVLKSVTDEELIEFVNKTRNLEYFSLVEFYRFIYGHTNNCLYTIYKELEKFQVWGHFVNMFVECDKEQVYYNKQNILDALEKRNISLVTKLVKDITDISMQSILEK
ncbi:MAG: GntR family transcriptional regulator [Coprobacillus sp.]